MTYFCGCSVHSIADICDEPLKSVIELSDRIRNETLNRLVAMPGYEFKSLKWKNIYYDYHKKKVMEELCV